MMSAIVLALAASPYTTALVETSSVASEELDAIIAGERELPGLFELERRVRAHFQSSAPGTVQRARLRGLVPRLDLSFGTDADLDVRDGLASRTTVEGRALALRVAARFELGQLVYADAEPRLRRAIEDSHLAERKLLDELAAVYFARVEVLLAARAAPSLSLALRARQLDAQLRTLVGEADVQEER